MLIGLLLGFTLSCVEAQEEPTVTNLTWDSPFALKVPNSEISHPDQDSSVLTISRIDRTIPGREDESVFQATLFRMENPKLTSSHYVITGEVAYQNLPDKSQLELVVSYLESGSHSLATNERNGPQGHLAGTSDFRPFMIRFSMPDPGRPLQLEINVVLCGGSTATNPTSSGHLETLSLRNLKLIQYPNPPEPIPAVTSPITSASSPGIDWKSFWIGMATSALALLGLAQLLLLARRWKRIHHERELRRMASLDS